MPSKGATQYGALQQADGFGSGFHALEVLKALPCGGKCLLLRVRAASALAFQARFLWCLFFQSCDEMSLSAFNVSYVDEEGKEALATACIPAELPMASKAADHLIGMSSEQVQVVVRNILEKNSQRKVEEKLAQIGIHVLAR